jgi:hypothetical protein
LRPPNRCRVVSRKPVSCQNPSLLSVGDDAAK